MKPKSNSSRLCLLVEGQDDRHVIQHFWKKEYKEKPSFKIEDREGINNLIKVSYSCRN